MTPNEAARMAEAAYYARDIEALLRMLAQLVVMAERPELQRPIDNPAPSKRQPSHD